ncbi:hypothetical protein IEQ34_021973 [Dendrobium chrysotoxum]|uniref:Cytochrome P450 n=1 Tax=Dendrobium chrysotoxum TaxID=161865 RepID=A0AAV7FXR0_DENCH|nr:hypothetical protein IEQ34_021973 [Dendrobium chrysotoxum]
MFFSSFLCAVTLLLVWLIQWNHKWRNPRCDNGELPPGSMGLPLIGETLEFMAPTSSIDMHPFIKIRMQRYGLVFKTSLFGLQVVVSTDPELNYFSFYPKTFIELFGLEDINDLNDAMSRYLKSIIIKVLGPENLKEKLLYNMDEEIRKRLCLWSANESIIDLKDSISTLFFDVIAKSLISYDPSTTTIDLMRYLKVFISSVFSFPLNIPGTAYHRSLQASYQLFCLTIICFSTLFLMLGRKIVMNLLKTLLLERMSSPRKERKDCLDLLVDELGKENSMFTEKSALNLIFVLLIASFVSTSRTISLATKFLSENPKILKDLTVSFRSHELNIYILVRLNLELDHYLDEHEADLRNRDEPDSQITWEEYKSMSFTQQVIKEAGRLANIVPANFRKTTKDFAINGYIIPKDWIVMIYPPATHLNPQIHEDPLTFNPSRWKVMNETCNYSLNKIPMGEIITCVVRIQRTGKPESNRGLVFGGGMRYCVGAEFSKLEMAIFLHYFVTKCRWKDVKGGNIVRSPGFEFPDGYHIEVMPKNVGVL